MSFRLWPGAPRAACKSRKSIRPIAHRPRVELLEDRLLLATFTVEHIFDGADNNPGDGVCLSGAVVGFCTLRAAIQEANATSQEDTIKFDLIVPERTISLEASLGPLPDVTQPAIIDATTQPGYAGFPIIELVGSNVGGVSGLRMTGGNSTVKGLVINRFNIGIELASSNNRIENNFLGTNVNGNADLGNSASGVYVGAGANDNTIGGSTLGQGNLISGNDADGILILSDATRNRVLGNLVGTDYTGTIDIGNGRDGVLLLNAPQNTIGGTTAAARNFISGNNRHGIAIVGTGSFGNQVSGNSIGTQADSNSPRGNSQDGVHIEDAPNNGVGGAFFGSGNVISANGGSGVVIVGGQATGNFVLANRIGTGLSGTNDLGNQFDGVFIGSGASNNVLGLEGLLFAGNTISGNNRHGVAIADAASTGNRVFENLIGTTANGASALGNSGSGVFLENTVGNTIGSTDPGDRNVISANQNGIELVGASGVSILGNFIGTDSTGTVALGNSGDGVHLRGGANNNTVGGTAAGSRNVISANNANGVRIAGVGANANLVQGNYIGTDSSGTADLGNGNDGVQLVTGASFNTVGGTTPQARNVISGNNASGIAISGNCSIGPTCSNANVVQGNFIGTNAAGSAALGNSSDGVFIEAVPSTRIEASNVISGNSGNGVSIRSGAGGTTVDRNRIGTDATGSIDLGNSFNGVVIVSSPNSLVSRNLISGNNANGVEVQGNGASGNFVTLNIIGADATATADLGNSLSGVSVFGAATNNTIGGTGPGNRNLILGNDGHGVFIGDPGTTGNVVGDNFIGASAIGALGNSGDGVQITNGAASNTVGPNNVISANGLSGVGIGSSNGNVVKGNFIGTDTNGTIDRGNTFAGIFIAGANNTVGGTAALDRNVISGNGTNGIQIQGSGAIANSVQGNFIGTNAAGSAALGNSSDGVFIEAVPNTRIEKRNVISGNGGNGVSIRSGASTTSVFDNHIGTDATGNIDLGNAFNGVVIVSSPNSDVFGNLISGNNANGVEIQGSGANGNFVTNNRIGTDANGTLDLGNTSSGVSVFGAATNNRIGGEQEDGNVISGNDGHGVFIGDPGTTGNVLEGNHIGTSGTAALGNSGDGVQITNGAASNTVGPNNVISANGLGGIGIGLSNGNVVKGNFIGTDQDGTIDLGNTFAGVFIAGANNTVGGTVALDRNVISGNGSDGVQIQGSGATANRVQGNFIGMNSAGTSNLGNTQSGVSILGTAANNTVGGSVAAARNVISGNHGHGVFISDTGTTGNLVQGNFIGTSPAGTDYSGNILHGVEITLGAANNTVGPNNVISANGLSGVAISSGSGNLVKGNFIGTDVSGAASLGNSLAGVSVAGANNTVGGTVAADRNTISGNSTKGVEIQGSGATGNVVRGNFIGTDANGTAALANFGDGVQITNGAVGNAIGGTLTGTSNVISGNRGEGIRLANAGTTGNSVLGNFIGTDVSGAADLGNGASGIFISGASGNTVGGTAAEARNVISGNDGFAGIAICGDAMCGGGASTGDGSSNVVQGNFIGTNASGTASVGNNFGVSIDSAPSNTIGGSVAGAGNVISGNNSVGVVLFGGTATGNSILRNSIFSNAALGIDLGLDGVTPNDLGPPPDGDMSPNNLQNYPDLTRAGSTATSTIVGGVLASTPSTMFTIEFFSNATCDFPEGQTFLASKTVTTGSSGNVQINETLSTSVAVGKFITATATDPGSNTSEFSACVEVKNADLLVTKADFPDPVNVGNNLTYIATVTNNGPSAASGVMLTDSLPANVTFVSATPTQGSCSHSGGTVTCELGGLASGANATVTIIVTPTAAAIGTINNSVSVTAVEFDPMTTNNSATQTTTVNPAPTTTANLLITKSDSPDPVNVGTRLTYTTTVTNNGPDAATGVMLTDTLPANVAFVSATPTQGNCTHASGTVSCNLGALANGSNATIAIVVTPSAAAVGTISNTASVTANEFDPNTANNSATQTTTVNPTAGNDVTGPTIGRLELARDAKGKKVTQVNLIFDEALNSVAAQNMENYSLTSRKGKKVKPVLLRPAVYDPAARTVKLALVKPIATKKLAMTTLTVSGARSLTDPSNNLLDGDSNGTAGGDFVRPLSQGVILSAIDALLETGNLSSSLI